MKKLQFGYSLADEFGRARYKTKKKEFHQELIDKLPNEFRGSLMRRGWSYEAIDDLDYLKGNHLIER